MFEASDIDPSIIPNDKYAYAVFTSDTDGTPEKLYKDVETAKNHIALYSTYTHILVSDKKIMTDSEDVLDIETAVKEGDQRTWFLRASIIACAVPRI